MTESQYIKTLSVEILAYLEYKENEAHKNGVNSGSVEDDVRRESAGKSIYVLFD
jgi:hypothetical protein